MKLLLLLFNVFMLLLPGLPCADRDICNDTPSSTISASANTTSHEQEDEGCNPFCACACCGHIASANFQLISLHSDQPIEKEIQIRYPHSATPANGFCGNIWQPPKS